jgi:hypothetical protein
MIIRDYMQLVTNLASILQFFPAESLKSNNAINEVFSEIIINKCV